MLLQAQPPAVTAGRPEFRSPGGEDMLRRGIEAGGIVVWCWDVEAGRLSRLGGSSADPAWPPDTFDGTLDSLTRAIHPDDRSAVAASLARAIEATSACRVAFRLLPRPGGPARWIEARAGVTREDGRAIVTGTSRDISHEKTVEAELVRQARRQEAVAALGREALAGLSLDVLLQHAAASAADLLDADFAQIFELPPGGEELVMRAGIGWDPALLGRARLPVEEDSEAGFTLRSPEPVIVEDLAHETRFRSSAALRAQGVVSGIGVAVTGEDRRAFGLIGVHARARKVFGAADAAFLQALANVVASAIARQRAQESQELLIGELQHRTGNLFALVLSLLGQTARGAASVADLEKALRQRVGALARAHTLILRGGWRTATLQALVREILAPYLDRTSLSGPEAHLPAEQAFALSMALHELATNAGKYGCFAGATGRLALDWRICREKARPRLVVEWTEHCGRPIVRPHSEGFGSQLIRQVIERRLDGKLRQTWGAEGLIVRIVLPVAQP